MKSFFLLAALVPFLFALSGEAQSTSPTSYQLNYTVSLYPEKDVAKVEIDIVQSHLLKEIDFRIDPEIHQQIEANGKLTIKNNRAVWIPPKKNGKFSLYAQISHKRKSGNYDALMTRDWAIFRGDDLVPPAKVSARKKAQSDASMIFNLPKGWTSVTAGWPKLPDGHFVVDNPERRFDRPTGWIIAGKLGIRLSQMKTTQLALGSPKGDDFRRMDTLAFLRFVWPHIELALVDLPPKILVVGAGEPMWRGGLSAPNSLFLHASRPLVSENGTSPLLHEIFHVITRIRGKKGADWIAEGLAEYYSFEWLYRSGGIDELRRSQAIKWLKKWGREVESLAVKRSSGPITARAVVLFDALDQEIRKRTQNKFNMDNVVQELMKIRKVTFKDLKSICEELVGGTLVTLNTPLVESR